MTITLLCWIWITISAGITGFAAYLLLDRIMPIQRLKPHLVILLGLCVLSVYAQLFSLFYKVGLAANILLVIICFSLLLLHFRSILFAVRKWIREAFPYRLGFILSMILLLALRSSTTVLGDDVYLYHAHAVRWVTEYGVVPGLGNLNTRFAFNSAYYCLQALFTFEYAPPLYYPLHSVNGYAVWILLSYAVCEMKFWQDFKFHGSDFARVAMIMYLCKNTFAFSSPGTDILAPGLIIYIFAEWFSVWEESRDTTAMDGVLCVLIVFAVTVKMSVVMSVLLVLFPAVQLIRSKNLKGIVLYLVSGIIVLLPFLFRNIIVSGWLVYPFEKLDLFSFDWKMPAATVRDETIRTLLGARKVYNFLPADSPFSVWFPHWVDVHGKTTLVYLIADLIAAVLSVFIGIRKIQSSKDWRYFHTSSTLILCLIHLMISAPNPRYGKVYMLLLPLITVGTCLEKVRWKSLPTLIPVAMTVIFTLYISYIYTFSYIEPGCFRVPTEYNDFEGVPYSLNGLTIYVPKTSKDLNAIGWDYFPSIVYEAQLDLIELRGDTFAEGFRAKPGVEHLF